MRPERRVARLDDTPIDIFHLTAEQQNFRKYALSLVAMRKKYNAYFAFPWLEDGRNATFLKTANNNTLGLLLEKPALGDQTERLLVLFNLSASRVEFQIPRGTWQTHVDSCNLKADAVAPIYPPASDGVYGVAPFCTVWLVQATRR